MKLIRKIPGIPTPGFGLLNSNALINLFNSDYKLFNIINMITNRTIVNASYGTHITPLVAAFLNTRHGILELGMGDYSTPVLHLLASYHERELISVESYQGWADNFMDLTGDYHEIMMYKDFEQLITGKNYLHWGMVLIDHAPAENRIKDLVRLRGKADVFVVHDTEKSPYYGYEPILSDFKYRYDYPRYAKRTTLVSDVVDVTKFFNT